MLKYLMPAFLAAPLALAAAPANAANGWHAVQEHASEARTTKADLYYAHHRLRVETEGESTVMIIDLPSGDLTLVDGAKKMFAKASLQELVDMREKMKEQMKARMAQMPEELRKNVEKMLAEQEAAQKRPLQIKKTKKKEKVAGYGCDYYDWTGPEGSGQSCISAKLPVDLAPFQKDAKRLAAALAKTGAGSSAATNVELLQMAKYGFPLKTVKERKMGPQTFKSTATLVKIEKATLAKGKFEAPKGFSKKTFQEFMQLSAALR